ncbi:MAG: RusA family crossover junction endodeoxyribonuclease [Ruminococcus sp.]|nr:RusA family crossover junction endodeoxyribonuclease [Ruminococcus sp.]
MRRIRTTKFVIYGQPTGWQRSGQNWKNKKIYTQDKTRQREQEVKIAFIAAGGRRAPDNAYIVIDIAAYYQIPESAPKYIKEKMRRGEIRPTVKPDYDNVAKLIGDGLNKVAYYDDKSIIDAHVCKFYADVPKVVVTVTALEPER